MKNLLHRTCTCVIQSVFIKTILQLMRFLFRPSSRFLRYIMKVSSSVCHPYLLCDYEMAIFQPPLDTIPFPICVCVLVGEVDGNM